MAKLKLGSDDRVAPASDKHDKVRAIYADPVKYAAWRMKMGLSLPSIDPTMDDMSQAHLAEVRRLMTEAKTKRIDKSDRERLAKVLRQVGAGTPFAHEPLAGSEPF